jgi:hypothetical protein
MNQHKSFIETFGPKHHRRCRIVDRERGYWAGEDWNQDAAKARLFYSFADAAQEYALIQTYENLDKPSQTFETKVSVTVIGPEIDLEELQDYLVKATKLSLVRPSPNAEPVLVRLHWDQLELAAETEGSRLSRAVPG